MRKGKIYKITNLLNNKIYIGQTILDNPMLRWKDHYNEYKNINNNLYLYKAMRKSGIINFIFQIIEEDIDEKDLNDREKYYIKLYNSNIAEYGYNLTPGGDSSYNSKYTKDFIRQVITLIKNNPEKSLTEIGNELGISVGTMSDINCGDTWCFSDESYPIRKNVHYKLNNSIVNEIIERLKTGESATSIAKDYGVSVTNVCNINKGLIYKRDDLEYPIYKAINSRKRLELNEIQEVIDLLLNTSLNYNQISAKLNIGRKTISNINKGVGYKDSVVKLGYTHFPLR